MGGFPVSHCGPHAVAARYDAGRQGARTHKCKQNALTKFDTALLALKNMRDIAEHFDDYAMDRGRDSTVSRKSLEVGIIGNSVFQWLGHELNADTAVSAAQRLFKDIQQAQSLVAREGCS